MSHETATVTVDLTARELRLVTDLINFAPGRRRDREELEAARKLLGALYRAQEQTA